MDNEEKQYRRQLMPHKELSEHQLLEEENYRKQMKQNNGETTMQDMELDDAEILEIEKNERRYRKQLNETKGISEEECLARIQDQKEKDKKEYDETQKQWKKIEHGRLSDD